MKKLSVFFCLILVSLLTYPQKIETLQKSLDSLKSLKEAYNRKILEIDNEYARIEKLIERIRFDESKGEPYIARFETGIYESNKGKLVRLLPSGSRVRVIDKEDEYYKITYNDVTGWVLIKMLASETAYKQKQRTDSIARIEKARSDVANAKAKIALMGKQLSEYRARILKEYGTADGQKILEKKIWLGMTDKMALESWGKPRDINRSVGAWGVKEQWVYSNHYLYFDNGKLTSWQEQK